MLKGKTEQMKNDKCLQCLRNKKGNCSALKERQWPCWAYIDDQGEFDRCEFERKNYIEKSNIA